MPALDSTIHTDWLRAAQRARRLPRRVYRLVRKELFQPAPVYGVTEWGDPETVPPLKFVRDRWLLPYVQPDQVGLEIGPGGGRWTGYLLGFHSLYVVDYHEELLAELRRTYNRSNIVFVRNNGSDFPSVPDKAVDFVFSFGVFVHLDPTIISDYLGNLARIVKPGANIVIQYADQTKVMARTYPSFSQTDPDMIRAQVVQAGFQVLEEDLTTLWHSSLIRFTPG
jgi:SAM-dependent methyltransferase